MKIFTLSGLGADKRAFSKLDFSGFSIAHLDWLEPLKDETIESYAARMVEGITDEEPILVGLSFGGMLAVEMAKIRPVKLIIQISSIQTLDEAPSYFKAVKYLKLNKIIPDAFYTRNKILMYRYMGVEGEEDKKLLDEFVNNADIYLLRWAIDRIVNWKNKEIPTQIVKIHGAVDKVFPIKNMEPTYTIENGGHFIIINRASAVSEYIREILHQFNND